MILWFSIWDTCPVHHYSPVVVDIVTLMPERPMKINNLVEVKMFHASFRLRDKYSVTRWTIKVVFVNKRM